MTSSLVEIDHLTIADAAQRSIVSDVSLQLDPGSVLGLVGESGCGKTTLALALLGYTRQGLQRVQGRVLVDGQNLFALPSLARDRVRGSVVAYVPQDPGTALNPVMRVGTQLDEMLFVHAPRLSRRERSDRIARVLDDVELPTDVGWRRRYVHQLSGGQQQRVAIAMAFLLHARLVVMDEPTTGLDVSTQARVLDLVRKLCQRTDAAVVYVTHDLAVVANLAPQIAVMYAGQIVEAGPTHQVLDRPGHPYTRGLRAAVPDLERPQRLVGIPGQAPDPVIEHDGCSYATRCPSVLDRCLHGTVPQRHVAEVQWARCHLAEPQPPVTRAMESNLGGHARGSPVLEVRGINASYAGREVVHDVSLTVSSGQCLAVVGESGSGKTTLARSIGGIHHAYRGDVVLTGQVLAHNARERTIEQRRRIQYVFQNPYASLNPRRTIGQSLEQPIRELRDSGRHDRAAALREALNRVHLRADVLDRLPRQLSGGQRQRVAIARALIPGPELLVCDEITSALDVSIQAVIVGVLEELRADGLSLLFVTHNLALVPSIAQEVAVLHDGQLVEVGLCSTVLTAPRSKEARDLLAAVPRLPSWYAA